VGRRFADLPEFHERIRDFHGLFLGPLGHVPQIHRLPICAVAAIRAGKAATMNLGVSPLWKTCSKSTVIGCNSNEPLMLAR
jgi:hypothetical protein